METKLVELSEKDGLEILKMLRKFPQDENGFSNPSTVEDLESMETFKLWLKRMVDASKGICLKEGYVPDTIFWIYEGDSPAGILRVRHYLNDYLKHSHGHVGCGILPQYRGKGIGSRALELSLPLLREKFGIEEALITTKTTNFAAQATIEKNGGIFDHIEDGKKFYWVPTGTIKKMSCVL